MLFNKTFRIFVKRNSKLRIAVGNKKINPKNTYRFAFSWMHGDADGNSSTEVDIAEDNFYLERFLKFVENFPIISGHGYRYDVPKDLKEEINFFGDGYTEDGEPELDFEFRFETDTSGGDGDYYASYSGAVVTYFDKDGIEYEASLIKSKNI